MFIGAQIIRPSDAKIKLAPAGPKRLELWAILLSLAANARCPLLVQSRHSKLGRTCPLSGVKRTSLPHRKMSAQGRTPRTCLLMTQSGHPGSKTGDYARRAALIDSIGP